MCRMLEAKDHGNLDMISLFVAAFVDLEIGMKRPVPMKKLSTKYKNESNMFCPAADIVVWGKATIAKLKEEVKAYKQEAVELFNQRFQSILSTLEIHVETYGRRPVMI